MIRSVICESWTRDHVSIVAETQSWSKCIQPFRYASFARNAQLFKITRTPAETMAHSCQASRSSTRPAETNRLINSCDDEGVEVRHSTHVHSIDQCTEHSSSGRAGRRYCRAPHQEHTRHGWRWSIGAVGRARYSVTNRSNLA